MIITSTQLKQINALERHYGINLSVFWSEVDTQELLSCGIKDIEVEKSKQNVISVANIFQIVKVIENKDKANGLEIVLKIFSDEKTPNVNHIIQKEQLFQKQLKSAIPDYCESDIGFAEFTHILMQPYLNNPNCLNSPTQLSFDNIDLHSLKALWKSYTEDEKNILKQKLPNDLFSACLSPTLFQAVQKFCYLSNSKDYRLDMVFDKQFADLLATM